MIYKTPKWKQPSYGPACPSLMYRLFSAHAHLKDAMSVCDISMLEALSDLAGGPLPE